MKIEKADSCPERSNLPSVDNQEIIDRALEDKFFQVYLRGVDLAYQAKHPNKTLEGIGGTESEREALEELLGDTKIDL